MKPKMFRLLALVALFGAMFILNSCSSGQKNCPVCGTDKNGTIGLIGVMNVPEHNPNGEPGGPFNIFDISWVDPVNRLYYVSDRIGLDVPAFSTTSNIALWAIGGQNSVSEAGNNSSLCWVDPASGETIPPVTSAQGNFTRFGCKTDGFRLPGGFGPNGNFGGFVGGQCCASRANNLNPLSGPNGLEITGDGNFMFVGNGSSQVEVFDLVPMISSGFTAPPTLTATIVTGTSPDYDGPTGITAKATRLHGARITLPYPSVGATETVLLSAVTAEGKTVLRNAATEPEVVELALFLQRMGAQIELSPDRRIVIEGVPRLRGASTRLAGDRLEAFSYLVAGLITRGEVRVHGCPQDRLVTAITTLARMGARVDITDEWITASAPDGLRPAAVHTDTHPGFMTDWQQPLMVLFTQADGMSVLHETVFENRLVYVPALQKMGCEIEVFAACLGGPACRFHDTNAVHSAVIRGMSKLVGADVTMPDVRAGFSAVLAASVADRPSVLRGIHHIERGYHRPFEQFASLGLTIRRG